MIRLYILILSMMGSSLVVSCSDNNRGPEAMISVKVIGEQNEIVNDSMVKVGFLSNLDKNKELTVSGKVNNEGIFSAKGNTNGIVGATISKDGYYNSTIDLPFNKKNGGRWEPWNPEVKVILKKIKNPVPMYARDAEIFIPELNKEIGFDLIEYDWIRPHGKGKHADFVIKVTKKYVSSLEFDGILTVSMPNHFDGIQLIKENRRFGSMFKLLRYAPQHGYEKKMVKTITAFPGKSIKSDSMEHNNYIFRIRSELKDGKFYRAMYGKIQGDLNFYVSEKNRARIGFKYYLNPNYTRNLEFDPRRNLFQALSRLESVGLD